MLLNCGVRETLEIPLNCKDIQPVHPKGNRSWIFIGRTDAEAETPILWPSDVKNLLVGKDPDAGKDWRQEEKGMTEEEMVGWHHQLNGHESEWTPGVGDGQGGLACCSPCGGKESDTTERLNWTELTEIQKFLPSHLLLEQKGMNKSLSLKCIIIDYISPHNKPVQETKITRMFSTLHIM